MFCRSLFDLLYFFCWLFFFYLRTLITPLVFSNFYWPCYCTFMSMLSFIFVIVCGLFEGKLISAVFFIIVWLYLYCWISLAYICIAGYRLPISVLLDIACLYLYCWISLAYICIHVGDPFIKRGRVEIPLTCLPPSPHIFYIFLCLSQTGLRWWGFSMFNEVRWVVVIRLLKFQNDLIFKQTNNKNKKQQTFKPEDIV